MKCMMLVVGVLSCVSAAKAIAACPLSTSALNYPSTLEVTQYQATTSTEYTDRRVIFNNCQPIVYARAIFNASAGELSSNSPFMVNLRLNESGLSEETKAWLEQNLELSFKFRDGASGAREVVVSNNSDDFGILPGSPLGSTGNYNGLDYFKGANGQGIGSFSLNLYQLTTTLKFVSSPSSNVVNELNTTPVRIKLGDLEIKTRDRNAEVYNETVQPMYLDLALKIKIPTCTMRDVNVDLGKTTLGQLKNNNVANLKAFEVQFQCDAIASGAIYSRITDAFNASNINSNGVLFNQPVLANAAQDVGVQLLTHDSQALAIGTRAPFIPTDESQAPTYRKALKAQLYRTGPNPTAGYVNAQATVLLDYE